MQSIGRIAMKGEVSKHMVDIAYFAVTEYE
jgi:hypothetical protein